MQAQVSTATHNRTRPSGTAQVNINSRAAAVSATKPNDRKRLWASGELCIALYKPKELGSNIWWPALRFPSIADFQTVLETKGLNKHDDNNNENNNNNSKSLEWSDSRKHKKHRKKLVQKVLRESLRDTPIETLCYLGRPLEDYVTADDAIKKGVEVQDFHQGLGALSMQARNSEFPGLFVVKDDEDDDNDQQETEIPELFQDYYAAMDEAHARHNDESDDSDSDSDDDDSDDDDSEEEEGGEPWSWASQAQEKWNAYQEHKDAAADSDDDEEDEPQQAQQRHQQAQHDEVSVAQSAAAISYTEASLMSASKAASVISIPRLQGYTISKDESFDHIWIKHQMEGWDAFYNEDTHELIHEAPNGYRFPNIEAFCNYLIETYGVIGTNPPIQLQQQQQQRGRSSNRNNNNNNEHRSSSRSRSRSREPDGASWKELWRHLSFNLGWTYNYPTRQDLKRYGMNTTALWFRPGFDTKHRGELGIDHFVSEDSVLGYCQEHKIRVMPTPDKPAQEEEGESSEPEEEEMEEESDEEEEGSSSSSSQHVASDDPGYATPDDQSTVPQDPGKPRLASPPGTSDSGSSGGSYYSYDNDPDRYVFSHLWQRLKNKGWEWCKAKNKLDDYWYIKPASMRPESQWIKGTDYFGSEEEVIDFCKKRDEISMKDREKRRNERLKRQQEEREAMAKQETTTETIAKQKTEKRGRPKKDKSNGKIEKKNTTEKPKKKRPNESNDSERGTKPDKKQKATGKRKKKTKSQPPQREGFSCEDKNLRVDFNGIRRKETPWVKEMLSYDHKVCLNAMGMTWNRPNYYLSGETNKDFSIRFQNVGDVARHFAVNPSALVYASGKKTPSNEYERIFERLIRYSLVTGLQSKWAEIRLINRSETSFLLRKLGYKSGQDASWEPPEALVTMGNLEQSYSSLESLCQALRCISGDLQTPPSAATRRRKQESAITDTQLMALRLRIAEDFSDEEEEKSVESASSSEEMTDKKRKREQSRKSDSEQEEQFYLSPSDEKIQESEKEEEQEIQLTPSEKKAKEFGEDEEQQIAMSPSRIMVGKFRKNPQDNTAPWTINPHATPKEGWHKTYLKMGFTYQGAVYYLPGESSKCYTKQFSKVEDICVHICQEGNYTKYLENLNSEERKLVKRHFDYGNVPGSFHDWRKLRELDIEETILFLNLLGFERQQRESGWWQIPEGVPILEERLYSTFSELCRALIRLPDLEDRSMGMGRRRRSRKKEEDLVLSDYQMMALRLRLAEGFGEEAESVAEEHQKKLEEGKLQAEEEQRQIEEDMKRIEEEKKKDEESNPLFDYTDQLVDQLKHATSYNPWNAVRNLGCSYTPGVYRVPGHESKIDTQNEMIEVILENSVAVLNWGHCTMDSKEIENFVFYLKAFHIRGYDLPLVEEALKMVTKVNLRNYLGKIGIIEQNGKYHIYSDEYSESDIVNMIRRSRKLSFLRQNPSSPSKRRRSADEELLSKVEQLSLRLWAVFIDIPLTNMPDKSTIGRSQEEGNESDKEKDNKSDDEEEEKGNEADKDADIESDDDKEDKESLTEAVSTSQNEAVEDPPLNNSGASKEHASIVNEESRDSQSEENTATTANQIVVPSPPSKNLTFTEPKSHNKTSKKLEATFDSLVTISKQDDATPGETRGETSGETSEEQSDEMEIEVDVIPGMNTTITIRESPVAERAITQQVSTEEAIPEVEHAPIKTLVQTVTEEAITSDDTDSSPSSKCFEPNFLPAIEPAIESASKIASYLMQANQPTMFETRDDSHMTPSPKKKRRKKNKRKKSISSPESTQVVDEFFTPKQHNVSGFKPKFPASNKRDSESSTGRKFQATNNKRKDSDEISTEFNPRISASKTASSHKEAFGYGSMDMLITQPTDTSINGDSLMTQPSIADKDDSFANRSAELDFDEDTTNLFSPMAVVATKKLKPSQQNYGHRYDEEEEDNGPSLSDLFTQQIEGDKDEWFDGSVF